MVFVADSQTLPEPPIISVSMWIPIRYQSQRATLRLREESISLSQSLAPDTPLKACARIKKT
jgi:hypothetical protein